MKHHDEIPETLELYDMICLDRLFKQYYKSLVLYAGTIIHDQKTCEDIVQNTFLRLLIARKSITIDTSVRRFLIHSVRNRCIDEIRHNKIVSEHITYSMKHNTDISNSTEDYVLYSELNNKLESAIDKLPTEEKIAFNMSRLDSIKYKDIAKYLNVSQRTVEVRISKALKILASMLKDYLPLLFFSLIMW